jgi:tetratricopeptide (TPR) repeat protein
MSFTWSSLEKIVSVAGGITVLALAPTDPNAALGTTVAAAGLVGWWRERIKTHGPEDSAALEKIRQHVLKDLAIQSTNWDSNEAIRRADVFLERHLLDSTLQREDIARSAISPQGFAGNAASVILGSLLSIRDPRDNGNHPLETADGAAFARAVIEAAFTAALHDLDYFARLSPFLLVELGSGIGRLEVAANKTQIELADIKELLLQSRAGQAAIRDGVDPDVIVSIATRLAPNVVSSDQALIALDRAAGELLRLRDEQKTGSNLGEFVNETVTRIAARIEAKDPEGAQAEGARAFEDWRQRKEEAERREMERRDVEQAAGIRLARETARAAYLAGHAASVAHWMVKRIALETNAAGELLDALNSAHTEWWERGRDQGLNLDLAVSAEIAQHAIAQPRLTIGDYGIWQNKLGIALATIGERESGTAQLEAAVQAFEQALLKLTGERLGPQWAATQTNLGNALRNIGEREAGTARLEAAVHAFEQALLGWTRERAPLEWATTQNNLGCALATLGAREPGTARLETAVHAFEQALLERKRELVPLAWAGTQDNLGIAQRMLGRREAGTTRLEAAVHAHQQSLLVRRREHVPLAWASAQNNLGSALMALGEREVGTARMEAAIHAFEQALLEQTRERVPLDWALTKNNLAIALRALGAREAGTARLEAAVEACQLALLERTRECVPLDWAATQNNLGNALASLGEREVKTAPLEAAVHAFEQALLERTRERVPLDWAATHNNRGNALRVLGEREAGTSRLEAAVEAYQQALLEYTRERLPLDWALTTLSQCLANVRLAVRQQDSSSLDAIAECAREANEILINGQHAKRVEWAEYVLRTIAEAHLALGR